VDLDIGAVAVELEFMEEVSDMVDTVDTDMVSDMVDTDMVDADMVSDMVDTDMEVTDMVSDVVSEDMEVTDMVSDAVLEDMDTVDSMVDMGDVDLDRDLLILILTMPDLFPVLTNAILLGVQIAVGHLVTEIVISHIYKVLISLGITPTRLPPRLLDDARFPVIKKIDNNDLSILFNV
jgi:hypothetical protein